MKSIKNNSNKQFKALEALITKTWGQTTSPSSIICNTLVRLISKRVWATKVIQTTISNKITLIEVKTTGENLFTIRLCFYEGVLGKTTLNLEK